MTKKELGVVCSLVRWEARFQLVEYRENKFWPSPTCSAAYLYRGGRQTSLLSIPYAIDMPLSICIVFYIVLSLLIRCTYHFEPYHLRR